MYVFEFYDYHDEFSVYVFKSIMFATIIMFIFIIAFRVRIPIHLIAMFLMTSTIMMNVWSVVVIMFNMGYMFDRIMTINTLMMIAPVVAPMVSISPRPSSTSKGNVLRLPRTTRRA